MSQVLSKETLLAKVGILKKWASKDWHDFTVDDEAKHKAIKFCEKYNTANAKGVGLYIYGANGVGKTLLAMLILKELFLVKKQSVRAISLGTLINLQTLGWYDKEVRSEFLFAYQSADFLLIEGVGREHKSGQNDLGATTLDTVLSYRSQAQKATLITATHSPKEIRSVYNADIGSLLNEMCVPINIKGIDYRNKIHTEKINEYHF